MKKKLLSQAITLGLLVAAPYSVWASDFTDGFHKDVQLNVDSSKLDCGAVAPPVQILSLIKMWSTTLF